MPLECHIKEDYCRPSTGNEKLAVESAMSRDSMCKAGPGIPVGTESTGNIISASTMGPEPGAESPESTGFGRLNRLQSFHPSPSRALLRPFLKFSLFLIILSVSLLPHLAQAEEPPSLYKKPQQIFDLATIQALENRLEGGEPLDALAGEIERQIARYTSQFSAEKRIQVERSQIPEGREHWDVNLVRLIQLARNKEPGSRYFLGYSPYMYRLHVLLGQCYERQGDMRRALAEYNQAFRYNPVEIPYNALLPVKTNANQPLTDAERERIYLSMLDGFADPDRIAQESNNQWANEARRFRNLMEEYTELKKDLEQQRKQPAVARSVLLRGGQADPAAEEQQLQQMENQMQTIVDQMESIRTGAYLDYKRDKEQKSGDLVFRMAELTREIEKDNKQHQRLTQKSQFYGDSPTVPERTEFSNFVGYGILLELAHRIDPDRLKFLEALSEEYSRSRKTGYAIEFEIRFLELAKERNAANPGTIDETRINNRMSNLAGLYTDERRYLKAIEIYEELLSRAAVDEPGQGLLTRNQQARYHLAELYFQHTGQRRRSMELYEQVLQELPGARQDDFGLELERQRIRFRIQNHMAELNRKIRRTDQEKSRLDQAREIYFELEGERDRIVQEQNDLKERILTLKQQLRTSDDPETRRQYYRLLYIEQPDVDERLGDVRTGLAAMDIGTVLERRAFLHIQDHEFDDAISLYNEMLSRAESRAASRARKNIIIVNRTLEDGILRRPELPAQW
ncbi:MAG: hypothetical protein CMN77_03625 [Spirochaetaceae bacterium]|nr:hypothetical protein [Spirochaetaceae bacterium]